MTCAVRGSPRSLSLLACIVSFGCVDEPSAAVRFPDVVDEVPRYAAGIFPSDLYLEDGRVARMEGLEQVAPLGSEFVSAHLEALDGFGLRPLVEVFVDGSLDAASVPAETSSLSDPLFVVNVDTASHEVGRVVRMQWRVDELRARVAGVPFPGEVLREGARYAVVVTRHLRDAKGVPLAAPEALRALGARASEDLPARWRSTRDALTQVAIRGFAPNDIVGFAAFTTQHASQALLAARSLLDDKAALPPPSLSFPDADVIFQGPERLTALLGSPARDDLGRERLGWSNPSGMAHDDVGVIGTGIMRAPRFVLAPTGSGLPGDDTFDISDETGAPRVVEQSAPLPVTFVLPSQPAPSEGYPVAIFGHGLGASRHQVLAFAAPLAARGFAVVAIDANGHGSRFRDTDSVNNNDAALSDFEGDPDLRDGFGDVTGVGTTFALVHEFKNTSAIRDSVRQSVLDLCSLTKLLRSSSLDLSALVAPGAPAPRFDSSRIVYLGESFGGVVGSVFAAVEPGIDLFVLDVPGGGILDLAMLGSPTIRGLVELWVASVYGIDERLDRFHPLVGMAQAVIDGADPLTYVPHVLQDRFSVAGEVLGPRHLIVLEVLGDEVLPNRSTHALARAAGLPLLAPGAVEVEGLARISGQASANVRGQTAALVQWSPATHGANWTSEHGTRGFLPFGEGDDEEYVRLEEPVHISNPIRETLVQVLDVLESHEGGAAPVVEAVHTSVLDFDADGMGDDDERDAGRDPYDPAG